MGSSLIESDFLSFRWCLAVAFNQTDVLGIRTRVVATATIICNGRYAELAKHLCCASEVVGVKVGVDVEVDVSDSQLLQVRDGLVTVFEGTIIKQNYLATGGNQNRSITLPSVDEM